MSDLATIAALAGLAGLLALDATAVLQVMVSQPIVAGALAGLVCGDVVSGTLLGAVLQLVWLGALPVGAAGFPDAPVGTVVGVGLASLLIGAGLGSAWSTALGIAVALAVGAAGRNVVARLRRFNVRLAAAAAGGAAEGNASSVSRAVALGILTRFGAGVALAGTSLGVSYFALRMLPLAEVRAGFPGFIWAAPIAAAVVAHGSRKLLERTLIVVGFLVGMLLVVGR